VGPFRAAAVVLEVGYHQQRFVLPDIPGANYLRLERR
jgi:hypothetical protein